MTGADPRYMKRYCPAYGPGYKPCPPTICDCFIEQFPDDMEQAGAPHPEFFIVVGTVKEEPVNEQEISNQVDALEQQRTWDVQTVLDALPPHDMKMPNYGQAPECHRDDCPRCAMEALAIQLGVVIGHE